MKDEFGNRMKAYEKAENPAQFGPGDYVAARIDGRTFSKFTKSFNKPFDPSLMRAMRETTRYLIEKTNAVIGYTQSDEITLLWKVPDEGEMLFNGKKSKLTSVLASMATIKFASSLIDQKFLEIVRTKLPHFDCRVWKLPNAMEATNVLLWRAQDARRNAVTSAARSFMSHKKIQGMDQTQMIESMREDHGIDFHSAYSYLERYGTFFVPSKVRSSIPDDVWERIPEPNRPESRTVYRTEIKIPFVGYFGDIKNRAEFVFEGAPFETA